MMRKAFTLIEVNLAMLVMAGGILSIVGLYAFGFRENRQSREDVAATALADSVMSPQSRAEGVFSSVMGAIGYEGNYRGDRSFPSAAMNGTGMSCGLVVLHEEDSAIVKIAFRAVKTDMPGQLLAMPLFYTEVRFQGRSDK